MGIRSFGFFVSTLFTLAACVPADPGPSAIQQRGIPETTVNLTPETVITVGNHSYIVIGLNGNPVKHVREILNVLAEFERTHPELEVTSWGIEKRQAAHGVTSRIFGLWVNHRLRPER